MKMKTLAMVSVALLSGAMTCVPVQARSLADIEESGVLRVGTTGDYKPMSYLNPQTKAYEGFDAEMAASLAQFLGVKLEYVPTTWKTLQADTLADMSYLNPQTKAYEGFDAEMAASLAQFLGVKLEYVPTTWKTLQADTLADKFDVAMCGVTVTDARKAVMAMSDPYLTFGKTVLVQKKAEGQFKSLADVNQSTVRVMYNPGGTNEKFAKEMTPKAQLIMHELNAEIPGLVADDKADAMITETMEARRYVRDNPKLAAPLIDQPFTPLIDQPFTQNHFGVLMKKDFPKLLAKTNEWMKQIQSDGTMKKWEDTYIK